MISNIEENGGNNDGEREVAKYIYKYMKFKEDTLSNIVVIVKKLTFF
jgi:hypothetical protein